MMNVDVEANAAATAAFAGAPAIVRAQAPLTEVVWGVLGTSATARALIGGLSVKTPGLQDWKALRHLLSVNRCSKT